MYGSNPWKVREWKERQPCYSLDVTTGDGLNYRKHYAGRAAVDHGREADIKSLKRQGHAGPINAVILETGAVLRLRYEYQVLGTWMQEDERFWIIDGKPRFVSNPNCNSINGYSLVMEKAHRIKD